MARTKLTFAKLLPMVCSWPGVPPLVLPLIREPLARQDTTNLAILAGQSSPTPTHTLGVAATAAAGLVLVPFTAATQPDVTCAVAMEEAGPGAGEMVSRKVASPAMGWQSSLGRRAPTASQSAFLSAWCVGSDWANSLLLPRQPLAYLCAVRARARARVGSTAQLVAPRLRKRSVPTAPWLLRCSTALLAHLSG